MKALVYHGSHKRHFQNMPRPVIKEPTDAIVKVSTAIVSGLDPRVMRGSTPRVAHGRILGHEGTGIIERVGGGVANFGVGDRVLISSRTSCGTCAACRAGGRAQCERGGWLLGNAIDGTYAEFVRVPFADHSLFPIPDAANGQSHGHPASPFPGGLIRDVLESDDHTDAEQIVFGGPVGMGPVLAVMQYYREVIRAGLPAYGSHLHAGHEQNGPPAHHSARRSLTRHPMRYFAPTKTR